MRFKYFCALLSYLLLLLYPYHDAIAQEVSLKQKIGQMLMLGFKGIELHPYDPIVQAILKQQIGGVILFDYDKPTNTFSRNIQNPTQLANLTQQLQNYSQQAAKNNKAVYPLLIAIDYEGGQVNRLKESYGFPKALSAQEMGQGSYQQAKQYAQTMAATLKQSGINLNLAPVVDINVNPNNPIIGKLGRSFSSDPQQVIFEAAIFSKIYQDNHIACTYKHFPGHGSSTADTHLGFVDITATWQAAELLPYTTLLKENYHCPIVMTGHVVHTGLDSQSLPASLSKAITTNLLRQQLNFQGVIITDDLQMRAITDYYGLNDAVILAINAGADILVFANQQVSVAQDPSTLVDMIYQAVRTGLIPENRIIEAYQHITLLKQWLSQPAKLISDSIW